MSQFEVHLNVQIPFFIDVLLDELKERGTCGDVVLVFSCEHHLERVRVRVRVRVRRVGIGIEALA